MSTSVGRREEEEEDEEDSRLHYPFVVCRPRTTIVPQPQAPNFTCSNAAIAAVCSHHQTKKPPITALFSNYHYTHYIYLLFTLEYVQLNRLIKIQIKIKILI